MSYAEEIIQKGTETLEKFLFLLKEDIILFEDRKKRDKNQFKNGEADLILEKMQKWLKQNENNEQRWISYHNENRPTRLFNIPEVNNFLNKLRDPS